MKTPKVKVKVEQNPDEVVEKPVLAAAIVDIARGFNKLLASGLTERAITVLVHDSSGVGKPDIRAVLNSLKSLSRDYTR